MKQSLRFSALIGLIAFLFWLPAAQQAEAQQPTTCEAENNLSWSNQTFDFAAGGFPAPYCGDRCEVEGEGRGCREVTAGGTFRTPCTCINGYWNCGP